MSLPYQSKFLYRGRRNSPVPHSSRFAGFDGPQYSLGSLSNKSGVDWALPRYVRDEPVMFMAGFGEEYEKDTDTIELTPEEYAEIRSDIRSQDEEETGFFSSLVQSGKDLYTENKDTINTLISTGMTVKQAYDAITGGQPSSNTLPPATSTTSTSTASIPPATPVWKPLVMQVKTIDPKSIQALATKKIAEIKALKAASTTTSSNIMLILGAVAVGAYLLLRKK